MQILRALPRPSESETGSGARNLGSNMPPCLTPGGSDTCYSLRTFGDKGYGGKSRGMEYNGEGLVLLNRIFREGFIDMGDF